MNVQVCLNCGMRLDAQVRLCPKCDNPLDEQTDGSTITVDIAHNGERVHEALKKLRRRVKEARNGVSQNIRFVVGSGAIREEALATLADMQRRGVIIQQHVEPSNAGAILVKLKP